MLWSPIFLYHVDFIGQVSLQLIDFMIFSVVVTWRCTSTLATHIIWCIYCKKSTVILYLLSPIFNLWKSLWHLPASLLILVKFERLITTFNICSLSHHKLLQLLDSIYHLLFIEALEWCNLSSFSALQLQKSIWYACLHFFRGTANCLPIILAE